MRYSQIPAGLFVRNRKKLFEKLPDGSLAIIQSNDQMVRSGDQFFPYRQNSDFFYLTGIEQEMSVLVLVRGKSPGDRRSMLFIRKPEPKLEIWEGRKLDKKSAGSISGISDVYWLEEMEDVLKDLRNSTGAVYFNVRELEKFKPDYPLRDERLMEELRKKFPSAEVRQVHGILTSLRLVKEPEELDKIGRAVALTGHGLRRVLAFVRPGLMEYQVEAELTHEFLKAGAGGHAYPPIIASGANACVLHYISNDGQCREGELLLMDFGAEYGNYAADCTRTVPVSGRYTVRQLELYRACLRVFREARMMFRPGITIEEINAQVEKLWEREHIELGLYSHRDLKEESPDSRLVKRYYPHGTAHFMGLDVHDVGGKKEPLKPGMVLTCEPGIYIREEGIGIRLENDLLITEEGNTDLMETFPMEPEEIEGIMNSR